MSEELGRALGAGLMAYLGRKEEIEDKAQEEERWRKAWALQEARARSEMASDALDYISKLQVMKRAARDDEAKQAIERELTDQLGSHPEVAEFLLDQQIRKAQLQAYENQAALARARTRGEQMSQTAADIANVRKALKDKLDILGKARDDVEVGPEVYEDLEKHWNEVRALEYQRKHGNLEGFKPMRVSEKPDKGDSEFEWLIKMANQAEKMGKDPAKFYPLLSDAFNKEMEQRGYGGRSPANLPDEPYSESMLDASAVQKMLDLGGYTDVNGEWRPHAWVTPEQAEKVKAAAGAAGMGLMSEYIGRLGGGESDPSEGGPGEKQPEGPGVPGAPSPAMRPGAAPPAPVVWPGPLPTPGQQPQRERSGPAVKPMLEGLKSLGDFLRSSREAARNPQYGTTKSLQQYMEPYNYDENSLAEYFGFGGGK